MRANPGLRERLLPVAIRGTAAVFVLFFSLALVGSATKTDSPSWVYHLFGWGSVGDAEEMMISAIYVVWGLFLWRTATAPTQYRFFLDFTLAANAAHFGVMLIQAIAMEGEQTHLVGDVLFGWAILIVLAVAWLPMRRRLA